MRGRAKIFGLFAAICLALGSLIYFLSTQDIALLQPKGEVAQKQYNLLVFAFVLSLFVVIPVLFMAFYIAHKYKAGSESNKYTPEVGENKLAEITTWGIPIIIVAILSVVIWQSSHSLDPFKPLASSVQPIKIQVVALQWKWLFIYPDEKIATTNFIQFPQDTPVEFQITADAPMNSFWIPALGGQIYAMSGMQSSLYLEANQTGEFAGSSANISGAGFADMKFVAKSSTKDEYLAWVKSVKLNNDIMTATEYEKIAKPNVAQSKPVYGAVSSDLFENVVKKYTHSGHTDHLIFGDYDAR